MKPFYRQYRISWSDIDANRHLANTAYSRLATNVRVEFFSEAGFDMKYFEQHHVGPVITSEKIYYYREAMYNELVTIDLELGGLSPDGAHFKFFQHFYKENSKLSARIELDITWLDLATRRLHKPSETFLNMFNLLPRAHDFIDIPEYGIRQPMPLRKSPA